MLEIYFGLRFMAFTNGEKSQIQVNWRMGYPWTDSTQMDSLCQKHWIKIFIRQHWLNEHRIYSLSWWPNQPLQCSSCQGPQSIAYCSRFTSITNFWIHSLTWNNLWINTQRNTIICEICQIYRHSWCCLIAITIS